ncbi:hypothetical protein G5B38_06470 [Pseudohalocynthiibacter aestuariivivens]|nr:aspartate/glutamate racemase family protein [Pseudohalocynthiibacter aestuariivivens]QIE45196.1 hypothetical protein G5B38_06470 [Pseudohalocynthiibacter aestuariivivens]
MTIPTANLVSVPLAHKTVAWRIGLVVLSSDPTIEHSFQRMLAQTSDIALHCNRIAFDGEISVSSLSTMMDRIEAVAAEIMPGQELDAILYGCTSASAAIGDDKVRASLIKGKAVASGSAHTPVSGLVAALEVMKSKKISLITPYPVDVTEMVAQYLGSMGVNVVALTCLGLKQDWQNGQISADQIVDLARSIDHKGADTLVLSCTALRGAEAIDEAEIATGMKVISSNQALLWHGLRKAGCDIRLNGFGELLRTH